MRVDPPEALLQPEQRQWLENCPSQLALALERDRLTIEAAEARIKPEAEAVRSTLLSGVSHDLHTPLAAIAGASSVLQQLIPTPTTTQHELLDTITEESHRLVENILEMSRLDTGSVVPNKQWHLLEDLIGSARQRLKAQLEPRTITIQISSDLPLLFVDGLLLEQVFYSLFENAVHYTPKTAHLSITTAVERGTLVITIADDGPGIPVGELPLIFDRFYRVQKTAAGGRGSGLGLAICRNIIQLHHGSIEAHQRPTGGLAFVIRLPLAENTPTVALGSGELDAK